jgi:hypothetical protein
MQRFTSKALVFFATLVLNSVAYAATSGVDYASVLFKNIDSTSPSAPTVVNAVTVICPEAGSLISTASAQITLRTFNGQAGEADVQYGISKDSSAADIDHHHLLRQYTDSGTSFATAHFQRIDTCAAGQRVRMRFVVHKLGAEAASAEKSSLVVTFISSPRL